MKRKKFGLSIQNLVKKDEPAVLSYTNQAMDPPTPNTPETFCGLQRMDLSPGGDSEFDESLAVPESLSIIGTDGKTDSSEDELDKPTPLKTCMPFNTIHKPPIKFSSVHRKVFIPGLEIKVKFTENERSITTNLLNPNLYTIELQHGDFTWTIRRRYKHILSLHQQLRMYRASLKIPFPTRNHKYKRASFKKNPETETKLEQRALEASPRPAAARKDGKPKKRKGALPRFPSKAEVLVPYDGIQIRMKQLEDYLYNLLNISIYRNHYDTVNFLEVSHLSFLSELGAKGKEGMVQKRTGSTRLGQAGCNCCGLTSYTMCVRCHFCCTGLVCAKWQQRWFFVKDTCFGYIKPSSGAINAVMLFDQGFEVSSGMYSTGLNEGMQLLNHSRQLVIQCWTKRRSKEWIAYLKKVANETAKEFTHPNVHNSFAPVRGSTTAGMLVDGSAYMSAVADAMELAREEIYITDWWLSPEIYMKRPALSGDYWRLDNILKRKAAQGVKVFIMLYKEVEMALGINSFYSKSKLAADNIRVFRHPDHARAGVFFWAHHEKIVVVDQTVAFLGGIDLCYGRWDDHMHRLIDHGSMSYSASTVKSKKKTSSSPGGGLYVAAGSGAVLSEGDAESALALAAAGSARDMLMESEGLPAGDSQPEPEKPIEENSEPPPQLPILEPGDHLLIASMPKDPPSQPDQPGPSKTILDKIPYRAQRLLSIVYPPLETQLLQQKFDESEREKAKKYAESDQTDGKEGDDQKATDANPFDVPEKHKLDKIPYRAQRLFSIVYPPFETELLEHKFDENERKKAKKYAETTDKVLSTDESGVAKKTPLAQVVEGRVLTMHTKDLVKTLQGSSKLWIGKDYCNFIVKDFNNLDLPFVDLVDRNSTPRMPWHDVGLVVEGAAARDVARHFIQRWNAIKLEKYRANSMYPYLLPKSYNNIKPLKDFEHKIETHPVSCQVVRSVSSWSCGFMDSELVEQSIHEAYVDCITRAQHYVYIENQFFITLGRGSLSVTNQIGEALYNRIVRAHKAGEVFRVFVVMPLLPGFEGEVGGVTGTSLHAVTHWNYRSINRSKESIVARLYEAGVPDPGEYITFHGLRTHSVLDGEPVTELVYVHSKLLVADDKLVVCGSANINDRSMIGKRDSEVAVVMQDEVFDDGTINGQPFPCGKNAGGLRKRLFREHLGLMDEDPKNLSLNIEDPCCHEFFNNTWKAISRTNTQMYEDVFHCLPTDEVHSFSELRKYQEQHRRSLWHSDRAMANRKIDLIRGYLVDLPLSFLCNEVLTPRNTSMEGMMPTSLWT